MSSILIATDYSEVGNNAAHYACSLAAKLGYGLNVLHTYMLPIVTADQPFPLLSVRDMETIATERMDTLLSELRAACPDVDITHRITYGDWRDASQEDGDDSLLTVVGNDGDVDAWLGSNTLDAVRTAGRALLAVPGGTRFTPVNVICLSCDAATMQNFSEVHNLLPVLQATGAKLMLVHVKISPDDYTTWNEPAIASALGNIPFTCHQIEASGSNIDEAIHTFTHEHGADWLAVIPHKHSFFHTLFGKSHTRAALRISDLPVLSIH